MIPVELTRGGLVVARNALGAFLPGAGHNKYDLVKQSRELLAKMPKVV
jgi:hypothetical protein